MDKTLDVKYFHEKYIPENNKKILVDAGKSLCLLAVKGLILSRGQHTHIFDPRL